MKTTNPLYGKRILIVEDEALIALVLVDLCDDRECASIVAATVDRALDILSKETFDAVVLDINLGGVISTPVAFELCRLRIPFVITSGYEEIELPPNCDPTIVTKPYTQGDVETALLNAIASSDQSLQLRLA